MNDIGVIQVVIHSDLELIRNDQIVIWEMISAAVSALVVPFAIVCVWTGAYELLSFRLSPSLHAHLSQVLCIYILTESQAVYQQ